MDLKKYIYGHCVTPVRVRTWDVYSRSYIVRDCPCGKCLHCKNTHINEWVTRLYAQALYSPHVYYITLDYAPFDLTSPVARQLASETAACYHNINSTRHLAMHPLVLCKNHLQDFFKRLRKNTSATIQYFACGEYGMHAEGKGYGRPHFHCIIFSKQEITEEQFVKAWTIHGYKIGKVDFHDLVANGSFSDDQSIYNSKFVFRYVCKYLQKTDFEFDKLATIDYHRAYFESLSLCIKQDDLFTLSFANDGECGKNSSFDWKQYVKEFSPFIVCSRRPSIGSAYFNENVERFNKLDFRLFGLPEDCIAFPSYYRRKVKENLNDFAALGLESYKVATSSRVGYILSVLSEIADSRTDVSNFENLASNVWRKGGSGELVCYRGGEKIGSIPLASLHMYDYRNDIMYQFNGYSYTLWRKVKKIGFVRIENQDILDVLSLVKPSFDRYYKEYVVPMHKRAVLQEEEFYSSIRAIFGDSVDAYERFTNEVYASYQSELSSLYKTKLLMQNSKRNL